MASRLLEIFFSIACFALCTLLAAACVRAKARALLDHDPDESSQSEPQHRTQGSRLALSLAAFTALAAFLGIPFGTLPALLSFKGWGALVVLACLTLASGFAGEWKWDAAMRRRTCVLVFLGLSLALCVWYARQKGMPGELFSLDTYVVTPLAGLMGRWERLGMLLLALVLLFAVRDVQQDLASGLAWLTRLEPSEARAAVSWALAGQVWILAVLGVAVCLFVPFSPAAWLGMSGVTGMVVNVLLFWLKVLIVDHVLWLARNTLPQLSARLPWAQVLLAGLGALCLFFV